MRRVLPFLLLLLEIAAGAPVALRVVAANLTSDRFQSYSPDNANHSNSEGAGARILRALRPDIVLIQEFNTTIPPRQWVTRTFGNGYQFTREEGAQIPNGVITRFPVLASGAWDDPVLDNREFAWARLRLPEKADLWVVSLHLHSKGAASREKQAAALVAHIRREVPAGALLLVGGDFNTRHPGEPCFKILSAVLEIPAELPADADGLTGTNASRKRPYDLILAGPAMEKLAVPVKLAGQEFPRGLVFDTRVFEPLEMLPPAQKGDSGVPFMQHMAVVRDFRLPAP